jgi:hypothetical protein
LSHRLADENLRRVEYFGDRLAVLEVIAAVVVGLLEGLVGGVVGLLELESAGVPLHQLHHLVVRDGLVRLDYFRIFHLSINKTSASPHCDS